MRHPTEGVLRRLLDEPAGVADADCRHVAACQECLGRLATVRQDADLVAAALELSPGSVGTTVRRAESALRKELNRHASSD